MKTTRKFMAILMVFAMILSMGVLGAFASGTPTTGTITITNATANVEYSIYKVFDLTYAGTRVSYSYTKNGENDPLYTALTGTGSPFTLTESSTAGVYNVAVNAGKTGEDIGDWLKTNVGLLGTAVSTVAATDGVVKFTGVAFGYYYVTSTLGAAVTVNSAMPNVEITDKNEKPTIDKKVEVSEGNWAEENAVNIGDTVNYKVDITVKNGAKNYVLHDTMSTGLSFNNSVEVKVGENAVDAANYTLTTTGLTDDCTFEVSFNNDYLAGLEEGAVITVYYSANLNDNAVIDGEGNPNTAKLNYGDTVKVDDDNNPDTPDVPKTPETVPDTTTTYTYAIALQKVDKDGNALANAEFKFPFYVNSTPDTDGAYIYAGENPGADLVNTITTPDSGVIVVKGVNAGTYNITETKAPAGYNPLTAPVSVTAVKTGENTTNTVTYLDEDGNVTNVTTNTTSVTYTNNALSATVIVVVNKAGNALPSTGAMGTVIFIAVGSLIAVAAVCFLVTKKRMQNRGMN